MKISIYQHKTNFQEAIDHFLNTVHGRELTYLASDLIAKGLQPATVVEAVRRATRVCQLAGLEVDRHFRPVYTQHEYGLIKDCRLSQLGYGLVMLNADSDNPVVARWQVELLERQMKG